MKTLFIYGYFLGLTLAFPITRFQEWKEGLNTDNNGDHGEKTAYIQSKLHGAETPKMDSTMQPSLNYTIAGIKVKKDESGVTNQTSSIGTRCSILKYQHRRDLSRLTQKVPKKKNNGKKHRPNKVIQSHNAHNTSRKAQVHDMIKHKIEKGSIIKLLQKRSVEDEDTPSDPYHSPDISYDWDAQENLIYNSQELNEPASVDKSTEDFSSKTINENNDLIDSSQSDHVSASESSNPRGSSESTSPVDPNESNSSNESSYNTESEESISDVANKPVVLNESKDSHESSEPNAQSSDFPTPASETTNGLSEAMHSSESRNSDDSSQSSDHNESSNSSDSSSNESSNSSDSSSSESSNSSDSKTSSHSTHSDKSTENSSRYTEDTKNTDDIEENEIDS